MNSAPHPPARLSREEAKKQTRNRLLDAALELLIEYGYENLTTGRVAKRAGMAQPTFYVHFQDMDELLAELATTVTRRLRRALRDTREPLRQGGDLAEVCRRSFELSLVAIVQHAGLIRIFVAEQLHPHSTIGRHVREGMEQFVGDLADELHSFPVAKDISRQRLRLFAQFIVSMAISAGLSVADGRYPMDKELIETLTEAKLAFINALAGKGSSVGGGASAAESGGPAPAA